MALHDNIQKITLDFNNPTLQTLRFHQYDKDTRHVIVTCMEYGKIVKIDKSTIEARVKWAKPDGNPVFNDEIINDDGTITIQCTEQMLAAHGYAYAEIMLLEKSTEKVLHTMPFKAVIQKAVFSNDTVTSSYEFDALNNALIKVKEAEKIIAKFPEWEQAENNRKQAEIEREIAEAKREKDTADAIANTNAATDNAIHAANTAIAAASNANVAADRADTSAANANMAADRADKSANDANIALSKMNDKLVEASTAITNIKNTEQSVKDAEAQRVSAENIRVTEFNEIKQQFLAQKNDADELITSLTTLKTSLEDSEKERNENFNKKMAEADSVISDTQNALSDANTAVDQAEKANEAANGLIERINNLIKDYPELLGNQSIVSTEMPTEQGVGGLWFEVVARN